MKKQIISTIKEQANDLKIDEIRILDAGLYFIISALLCYNEPEKPIPDTCKELESGKTITGNIASYTSKNYYKILYKKLAKLAKKIKPVMQDSLYQNNTVSVNGRLPDKKIAAITNLGQYCKNSLIYHPDFGTQFILGEIVFSKQAKFSPAHFASIINNLFETVRPGNKCHDCQKCIQACPTSAITESYKIDKHKCLQHLSSVFCSFGPEILKIWGRKLYGCTICQDVCPLNKKVKTVRHKANYGFVGKQYSLKKIMQTPLIEQRKLFKGNQMGASWVSQKAIRRNAIMALGTYKSDKAALILQKALLSEPDEIKPYIIQALKKTDNENNKIFLENQKQNTELTDYIRKLI